MRPKGVLRTIINCGLTALFLKSISVFGAPAMAPQDVVTRSSLVFRGTVTRVQSANLQAIAASPNTIVVKIDSVLRTTDPTNDYSGKEVTVYVKDPASLKVGDKAVFYTQGWILGENIAVKELNHTKLGAGGAAAGSVESMIRSALLSEGNKLMQQRLTKSDLVVEGRVVSTERVDVTAAGAGGPPASVMFSEHNPLLKKAVIEVSSVLSSGDGTQPKTITIIYPSSQDVAWIDAPKFQVGDAGVFVLEKAQTNLELKDFLNRVNGKVEGIEKNFIGINPLDFQPKSAIELIKPLLKIDPALQPSLNPAGHPPVGPASKPAKPPTK